MKAILALSAAALIAAAPTVFAHDASSSPKVHHKISKKLLGVYASQPEMQTTGWMRSYPGALGYRLESKEESNYSAGGGSGGGGGGGGGGM